MDDKTRAARHAESAEILQRILDDYGDDVGEWERQALERAIEWFREQASRAETDQDPDQQ